MVADGRGHVCECSGADRHVVLNWFEELKERVPTGGVAVVIGTSLESLQP